MRKANSHERFRRFAAVGLAVSLCLGILLSGLHGAQRFTHAALNAPTHGRGKKIANDLHNQVSNTLPFARVRVIVQPTSSWGNSLDTTLKGEGASVKGPFKNFTARSVEMNAGDVEALASRDDVAYVTPDRQVKLLGHVTLTSGTDAAAATAAPNRYDGAGLGLVVMDSGIEATHVAFADANG